MIKILKSNAKNPDFFNLVKLLDIDLAKRDGEDHVFYAQYNKLNKINHALIIYLNNMPVACGAIKKFEPDSMEVKRMFTLPDYRGQGLATRILLELENWAKELGYKKCVLETGKKQPEAIKLYTKNGYKIIPNYGQYTNIKNSVCFEKQLK